nr:hypothetical protein [Actinomycetota bacterium]
ELESQLEEEVGMGPAAIVANGLLSQRFSAAELEQLAAPSPNGRPPELEAALDAARLQGSRARAQQGQLRRLRRGARAPVLTLPQLLEGELGPEGLEQLARELERKL